MGSLMVIAWVFSYSLIFLYLACEIIPSETICNKTQGCNWHKATNSANDCTVCQAENFDNSSGNSFETCSDCNEYNEESTCENSSSCQWCGYANYCSTECNIFCEFISSEQICQEYSDKCKWCPSKLACRPADSPLTCYPCDFYSSSYCPPGCDCSENKQSSSILILAIVLPLFFVLVLTIGIIVYFAFKRKNNLSSSISSSNLTITFNDFFDETLETNLYENYELGNIKDFISCSCEVFSFTDAKSILSLNRQYSNSFTLENISTMSLSLDSLLRGLKKSIILFLNHLLVF